MWPARSSTTASRAPAGILTSRATRWPSTRSTTSCGWKTCGWTSRGARGNGGSSARNHYIRAFAAAALATALSVAGPASAQHAGGTLKVQHWDSPASMSIHEEATYSVVVPIMGVMNNLVLYKQDVAQNSLQTIVPDLAERWSWAEDGKELTFTLRQGVKWHDGKPFTAADV